METARPRASAGSDPSGGFGVGIAYHASQVEPITIGVNGGISWPILSVEDLSTTAVSGQPGGQDLVGDPGRVASHQSSVNG
jgi:hypothetical protein